MTTEKTKYMHHSALLVGNTNPLLYEDPQWLADNDWSVILNPGSYTAFSGGVPSTEPDTPTELSAQKSTFDDALERALQTLTDAGVDCLIKINAIFNISTPLLGWTRDATYYKTRYGELFDYIEDTWADSALKGYWYESAWNPAAEWLHDRRALRKEDTGIDMFLCYGMFSASWAASQAFVGKVRGGYAGYNMGYKLEPYGSTLGDVSSTYPYFATVPDGVTEDTSVTPYDYRISLVDEVDLEIWKINDLFGWDMINCGKYMAENFPTMPLGVNTMAYVTPAQNATLKYWTYYGSYGPDIHYPLPASIPIVETPPSIATSMLRYSAYLTYLKDCIGKPFNALSVELDGTIQSGYTWNDYIHYQLDFQDGAGLQTGVANQIELSNIAYVVT